LKDHDGNTAIIGALSHRSQVQAAQNECIIMKRGGEDAQYIDPESHERRNPALAGPDSGAWRGHGLGVSRKRKKRFEKDAKIPFEE
jgi:hypothetical protein